MTEKTFKLSMLILGIGFTLIFCVVVAPAVIESGDILGAFAAGFVNPFASGYSADVFFCWFILVAWVWFEAANYGIKHGWVCLLLGAVPGVAVGFALYLVIRHRQLKQQPIQ